MKICKNDKGVAALCGSLYEPITVVTVPKSAKALVTVVDADGNEHKVYRTSILTGDKAIKVIMDQDAWARVVRIRAAARKLQDQLLPKTDHGRERTSMEKLADGRRDGGYMLMQHEQGFGPMVTPSRNASGTTTVELKPLMDVCARADRVEAMEAKFRGIAWHLAALAEEVGKDRYEGLLADAEIWAANYRHR